MDTDNIDVINNTWYITEILIMRCISVPENIYLKYRNYFIRSSSDIIIIYLSMEILPRFSICYNNYYYILTFINIDFQKYEHLYTSTLICTKLNLKYESISSFRTSHNN